MKRIVLILTFLLVSLQSFAQTSFPVQLTPQVTPPYPVYISDYANTNSVQDKVRLQVILNDLTVNINQIRLKLYIQGEGIMTQSNDLVIGATPIFLEGGIPLQLGTNELAAYFEFQNLQGITPNTYGSALPEGIYQICFEAYDSMTNNVLSAKTCTTIVLFQNDPPLLNLPLNESVIDEQNPLNIVFQWTPRHINVSNVQYEFNLVEIWDNYVDPQAAFLSTPPIFQTTLSETTLIYGPSFPQLLTGKKYAWNVRAFALDGAEEIGVFSNQGNSEIFWFTFQTPCNAPVFPEVEELSDHHAKLIWQGDPAHIDFTVKYREKNAGSDWYEITTPREYITISDLNLETTYEYKILGNCDYGSFGETIIYEFTTLSEQASAYIGCNIEPDPADLSNQNLLPELYINDIITAGDFPVTVLILDQASTPFSGKGYAVVPWLGDTKLKVEFANIQVNTDMQLISGEIKTTYDADWGSVDFVDEVFEIFEGDNDITEVEVPFDIEAGDISVNDNGEIVINDPNSNVEITYPAGDDYVITDASGDVFYVDEEGNVTEGGEIAEGGPVDTNNMPGFSNGNITELSADGIKVIFNNDPSYTYGFDIIPDNERTKLSGFYDTITDAEGNSYDIAHKAVKNGGTDIIKGLIETTNDSLVSRLEFKTVQGVKIPHTIVGNEVTLDLFGHYSYENEPIYASLLPEQEDGQQTIAGVFTLWHLSQKDINLTIVEVNGASAPSGITASLNDIFGKAVVNFNVNTTAFNVDSSLYGGDTLLVGDSGVLANYTNEERAIINSFKGQQYDANQYYLFVFGSDIQPSRSIAGFMPLKRQFGFIFSNSNATEEGKDSVAKVMAHELGHGIFGLEHPFKQFETTQSATDWLLDYSNGSGLNHMEWAQIHNPGFQLYLFQDDEDGEYSFTNLDYVCVPAQYQTRDNTYVDLDGNNIILGDGFVPYAFVGSKTPEAQGRLSIIRELNTNQDILYYPLKGENKHFYWTKDNLGKYTVKFVNFADSGDSPMLVHVDNDNNVYVNNIPTGEVQEGARDCPGIPSSQNIPDDGTRCDSFQYITKTNEAGNALLNTYQNALNQSLENALLGISQSSVTEFRTKGVYNHIQFANSSNSIVSVPDLEILEDKLHLLAYKSEGNQKTNFIVSFLKIENNSNIQNSQINELAEKSIEENATLMNGNKVVYVVIPYSNYESIFGVGLFNNDSCFNIGYAENEENVITNNSTYQQKPKISESILELYKSIEKPLYVRQFYVKASGEMVEVLVKRFETGHNAIYVLNIFESIYVQQIKTLKSQASTLLTNFAINENATDAQISEFFNDYDAIKNQIKIKYELAAANEDVTNPIKWALPELNNIGNFREVYILDEVAGHSYFASQTSYFGFYQNFTILTGFNSLDEDLHFYDFDRFSVIDPIVYGLADVLSLIPIPYVDSVGDSIGLVYATARGDITQASFFALGLALPIGTAYLKAGADATQSVFVITAKKLDNGSISLESRLIKDVPPTEVIVSSPLSEIQSKAIIVKNALESNADNMTKITKYFDDAAQLSGDLFAHLPTSWSDEVIDTFKIEFGQSNDVFKILFSEADSVKKLELAEAWKKIKDKFPTRSICN